MGRIFVYGSLLADEVVELLLDRVPKVEIALVRHYERHRIKRRIYPAATKSSSEQFVQGRVFMDLSAEEERILDDFEDEDYYRETITAELQGGGTVQAAMYVWQDSQRSLLYDSWDYEYFRKHDLQGFLAMMRQWQSSGDFPEEVA